MFCELAVSSCRNLKYINIRTVSVGGEQVEAFRQLKDSLKLARGINLNVEFSEHIHDRQIM